MGPRELLQNFYQAFQQKDFIGMQKCYHPEATFSDPVFQNLSAQQVKAMWHMLCEAGKDLALEFEVLSDDKVFWQARYSFSKTGRKVHNKITAKFTFKDGLIHSHLDHFNLWKWSGMALGTMGDLLGWASFFQAKIRKTANGNLAKFIATHEEYQ